VGSSVLGSSVLRRRLVRGGAGRCAAAGAAVAMVQLRSYVYGIIAQEVERRLVLALADTAGKGAVVELQACSGAWRSTPSARSPSASTRAASSRRRPCPGSPPRVFDAASPAVWNEDR
jgi:hypothetical protein